jgi:methylthioribose-1-phosphate isomerase
VTYVNGVRITPEGVAVMNPAFDFTPMRYVKAIITEKGVFTPNNLQNSLKIQAT